MSTSLNRQTPTIELNEHLEFNHHQAIRLPYIKVPEINAKFLIDSGASSSSISTKLAQENFSDFIKYSPFSVTTMHNTTHHNFVLEIPSLYTFKALGQIHRFNIVDFSKKYDGILGLKLLEQMGAVIDIPNKQLITKFTIIPLYFDDPTIKIGPRQRKIVKIPVDRNLNQILISHQELIPGVEIPENVTKSEDYEAITEITNFNDYPVEFKLNRPLTTEIYQPYEASRMQTNVNNTIKGNISSSILSKMQRHNVEKHLRLGHLNNEEKQSIMKLCLEYKDICYDERIPLSFTSAIKHQIRLKDDTPIYLKPYRKSPAQRHEIDKQVKSLLTQNIITESASPWSAPISIVPKKLDASGIQKYRMVIDYRKLNEKTIEDKFPIPNISDMLDKLGKANYFTTLDLASGYHQIEMDKKDQDKTAFSTDDGHYEFKRMPFGLKNAPATFQRVMNHILRGLTAEVCLVYLDDIIIYSTSLQEHIEKLRKVFNRLRESNMKITLNKCEFLQKEVAYLGHLITPDGVKPNPQKIEAIKKYPIPRTQKEIKAFLGLLGYYRRFIKDFAKLTKPMTKLLKKGSKMEFTEEYRKTFEMCKHILSNEPILQYPDFTKPFNVTTDASNFAIGAILSQGIIGKDKVISYASRTLTDTEQKYSTIEKELLAIVWACKQFRPYIYGRKFTIITDHRPLVWLQTLKEPNMKLQRWKIKLSEYDYNVIYKKGSINKNADALSRIEIHHREDDENLSMIPQITNEEMAEILRSLEGPSNEIFTVPIASKSIKMDEPPENIQPYSGSDSSNESLHSNLNEEPKNSIPITPLAIDVQKIQFFIETHIYPTTATIDMNDGKIIYHVKLDKNNLSPELLNIMKELMPQGTYHIYTNDEIYKEMCNIYIQHFNDKGPKITRCTTRVRIIDKKEEKLEIIIQYHEGKSNHRGINETVKQIQKYYHWPKMKTDVTNYINNCKICQRNKYNRHPPKVPLQLTEQVDKPFDKVHIDTFSINKQIFLTMIDVFTKYAQAYPIENKTAIAVLDKLIESFSIHGTPKELVMDNGLEFNNATLKELLKLHKIMPHFTTPQNPNSNSPIERLHSTLLEHIRIMKNKKITDDTKLLMKLAILAYNSTNHTTTGITPFELLYGHTNTREPLDLYYDNVYFQDYIQQHKERTKHLYNQIASKQQQNKEKVITKVNEQRQKSKIEIGQQVYVKPSKYYTQKTKERYWGPYIVHRINENGTIEVKNKKNKILKYHINSLKLGTIPGSSSEEESPK